MHARFNRLVRALQKRHASLCAANDTALGLQLAGGTATILGRGGRDRRPVAAPRPSRPLSGSASAALPASLHAPDPVRPGSNAATIVRYHTLLKPGGSVYLDASAARVRNDLSTFFKRYIFQGNGTPLHLPDYVRAVTASPMRLRTVIDDRHNYMLTTQAWAEGLERHREEIERRWGRAQYRRFQIYLWGCVDGFRRDELQAYRLVMQEP